MPFLELVEQPPAGWQAQDLQRLWSLGQNTLLLVLPTVVFSLTVGTCLAILLFRAQLPCRRLLLFLLFVCLFIPLPVLTTSWQAVLGGHYGFPLSLWPPREGQPWTQGIGPAIWVHTLAAIPWVVLIAGQGLCWVESELEEDALQVAGPLRVLWHVTLVRCRPVLILGGIWVAVQTAGEISVTDMFLVRTYAEEIYTVLNFGSTDDLARAVALTLPLLLAFWLFLITCGPGLFRSFPPLESLLKPVRRFRLGRMAVPAFAVTALLIFLHFGVPLITLLWSAGYHAPSGHWSVPYFFEGMKNATIVSFNIVVFSLIGAALVGTATAVFVLVACWCFSGDRRRDKVCQLGLFGLAAFLWVIPGPVAGLGLKGFILRVTSALGIYWLDKLLYYGPSYLPSWWAHLLRAFPFAVVVLWPAVRLFPRELRDMARMDGASPLTQFARILFPIALPAALCTAVIVMALSVHEISASKHVATAGTLTFTQELFQRMHSGVTQDVSSLCLLMLLVLLIGGLEMSLRWRIVHHESRNLLSSK